MAASTRIIAICATANSFFKAHQPIVTCLCSLEMIVFLWIQGRSTASPTEPVFALVRIFFSTARTRPGRALSFRLTFSPTIRSFAFVSSTDCITSGSELILHSRFFRFISVVKNLSTSWVGVEGPPLFHVPVEFVPVCGGFRLRINGNTDDSGSFLLPGADASPEGVRRFAIGHVLGETHCDCYRYWGNSIHGICVDAGVRPRARGRLFGRTLRNTLRRCHREETGAA